MWRVAFEMRNVCVMCLFFSALGDGSAFNFSSFLTSPSFRSDAGCLLLVAAGCWLLLLLLVVGVV